MYALKITRKIRRAERYADGIEHLSTAVGKALGESVDRILPRRIVGNEHLAGLVFLLERPFRRWVERLPLREARANVIGRFVGHDGGCGVEDNEGNLRLVDDVGHRKNRGRELKATKRRDVLVHDHLLG